MKKVLLYSYIFTSIASSVAFAGDIELDKEKWNAVLTDVQNQAIEMKISSHTINSVIQSSEFIPAIVRNDKNQAEFKLSLDQYLQRILSDSTIQNGKLAKKQYPTLLNRVNKKYGVQQNVILALWGIESHYGHPNNIRGKYKLSDSFLTLIYDGRRSDAFKKQLFALMRVADKDKIEVDSMRGNWAGAMGHFQFMPTTLETYGIDGNRDGKIDIINSVSDAMFSAGNYLKEMGWNQSEKIVRRVRLPADFDKSLLDGGTKKSVIEWKQMGITNLDGSALPKSKIQAGLVGDLNNENSDLAYLAYPNFYRIRKWNNSNFFAIAVAELSEKLK